MPEKGSAFSLVLSPQPLYVYRYRLELAKIKGTILSAHLMPDPFIMCHDAPCASHLLCKNNLTWQGTTMTELFLVKTFGNQFASPIILQLSRQSTVYV